VQFQLARLGVAGANALQSRTSQAADADAARVRALVPYKDFLALWKDADPDIPILKEAKAEYAKLRQRLKVDGWFEPSWIDVDKSAYHQLSHTEIAGDNPCSRDLSESLARA
jgi:hypothetical protein